MVKQCGKSALLALVTMQVDKPRLEQGQAGAMRVWLKGSGSAAMSPLATKDREK